MLDRRRFVSRTAAAAAAFAASAQRSSTADENNDADEKTGGEKVDSQTNETIENHCVFTKPLQSMSAKDLATRIAAMGFGGTECPVRRRGMVEPDQAVEQLPEHCEALAQSGLRVTIAATDINDPGDAMTETLLRLFSTLGITHYRMAYYRYDKDSPLPSQIDRWRGMMTDLAAMNHQYGLQGLYQNHAGYRFYSGPIWDLYEGIKDINPDHLGVAFDLRHAAVEGGLSWPLEWQLIRDHVRAFYVKDFSWQDNKVTNVPLGTGAVDMDFYRELDDTFRAMPISLHEEYLDHKDPALVPQHLAAIKRDYQTLRSFLK